MDPLVIAVILLAIGLLLLVAEMIIPSHGMLGIMAGLAFAGSVVYCFIAGPVLGLGLLAIMALASPFVFMGMMRMWPKTPVGKRLVLNATVPEPPKTAKVVLGAEGKTVTELRPIGECDFGHVRAEVISEYGMIAAGTTVKVVAHESDGRPIVSVVSK